MGNQWEFEGEQGMEESGVRSFYRLWSFPFPQELCLCLPEFASLFAISLTFKHTRISYGGNALEGEGGGLFNTSGKERKMAVSSQKSGFFSPKKRRRPQYFSPKKVSRGGAAQGSRCLLGLATSNKQV